MACFQLTGIQRVALAAVIEVGIEGLDTDESMMTALDPILAELQASDGPTEITIMPIDVG
jgi:hypothetical protein